MVGELVEKYLNEGDKIKEGDWVEILKGTYKGKVFKPDVINTSVGRVTGEISDKGKFYGVTLKFAEVKKVDKPNFED
jgi:transcription antitermination factor NusG